LSPFSNAIQEADTEHEIFFLLVAHIEALRFCDQLRLLPWQTRDLPLAGSDDLKARIYGLQLRGRASDVDGGSRLVVEETIDVFRTALRRLAFLQADGGLAHRMPEQVMGTGDRRCFLPKALARQTDEECG